MKKVIKDSITIRAAIVLLVLLLISLYISSGYLAKYINDDFDDNVSKVAKFDFVINEGEILELDLSGIKGPGDSQEYTFAVSASENNNVALDCEVKLETSNNLPLNITITPDGSTPAETDATIGNGVVYSIYSQTFVAPNSQYSDIFTINVSWPESANDNKYTGLVEAICLSVNCEQVD